MNFSGGKAALTKDTFTIKFSFKHSLKSCSVVSGGTAAFVKAVKAAKKAKSSHMLNRRGGLNEDLPPPASTS